MLHSSSRYAYLPCTSQPALLYDAASDLLALILSDSSLRLRLLSVCDNACVAEIRITHERIHLTDDQKRTGRDGTGLVRRSLLSFPDSIRVNAYMSTGPVANILLTLCGYIPGLVHALYVSFVFSGLYRVSDAFPLASMSAGTMSSLVKKSKKSSVEGVNGSAAAGVVLHQGGGATTR